MDEHNFKQQLIKYIDGELSSQEVAAFERFIEENPLARVELENEQNFDRLLRQHLLPVEAPYELKEQLIQQLDKPSVSRRFLSLFKWKPVWQGGFALTTICLIVTLFLMQARPFPIFAEAVGAHVDYLHGNYTQEIVTDDIDTALAWFEGRLDFAVARPTICPYNAKLVGARMIQINGEKAAFFMYEVHGRSVSAFVLNMENERMARIADTIIKENEMSSVYAKNLRGYENILCYHKNVKTGCLFVTDMSQEEFLTFLR